jgi:endonuclease/exonuclease/phosphatase family metal-dependent hydrolase
MTYNILNGGEQRLPAIAEVITKRRPDLLALQELSRFDRDPGRLRGLADAIGMRPYLARSRSRFGQPVALFVRDPSAVLQYGRLPRPFHHAAVRLTVRTERGPLTVIGTHLCPFSGTRRRFEAGWLARAVDPGGLALVMGDLNSLDPRTDHGERIAALGAKYRRRHLRRGGIVDTRAIGRLEQAGLVDLYRRVGAGRDHTTPTGYQGAEFSRMRLDYIIASPPLADLARSCTVVDDPPADTASDHYPVVADLDLSPSRPS